MISKLEAENGASLFFGKGETFKSVPFFLASRKFKCVPAGILSRGMPEYEAMGLFRSSLDPHGGIFSI